MHGHLESIAVPQEKHAPEDYGEGRDEPDLCHTQLNVGVPQGLHDNKGGDESVGDHNLYFVFGVKAKHRLLRVMARGLENVVAGLADEERSDAQVYRTLVVIVEDSVAIQEHRRADQVQELVDQVGVRSFVVDVLLPHDALVKGVIRVDHRLRSLLRFCLCCCHLSNTIALQGLV